MLKFILLSLIFVSSSATANIDCSAIMNQKVTVVRSTPDILAMRGLAGGSARMETGGHRVIEYDHTLEKIPEVLNHVIAHECAHHILGHVLFPNSRNYYANERVKEHPADCLAAKLLERELGYGDKEFAVISSFLDRNTGAHKARSKRLQQCRMK